MLSYGNGNYTKCFKSRGKMKIVIAGGGTGGHIFPAISIAEEIMRRSGDNEVLFVGTTNGMEKDLIPSLGFNLRIIKSRGIIGKGLMDKIKSIISALNGIFSSFRILRSFQPDLVLGVGGYVSGPTVLSAYLSFIPTAICEQNTVPGVTNRILSKFTRKIFVTFKDSINYFPENKVVVTGNPLRSGLIEGALIKKETKSGFTFFIMGGSQGATNLNTLIPGALAALKIKGLKVVHQTGRNNMVAVDERYKELGINAEVYTFINDIAEYYRNSDLIISRSGSGAISEITAFGKASVLVPYPYAAHNHQSLNAMFMENAGASVVINEEVLTEKYLTTKIEEILKEDRLPLMSEASRKLAKPDAAKEIVEQLYSLVGK